MDTLYWLLEYAKVFLGYLFLTFVWPSVVFRKFLKDKPLTVWFFFCVTVQIVLNNTVVLGLGLVHLLNAWVVRILFYGVFLYSLFHYADRDKRPGATLKRLVTGTYGIKQFVHNIWDDIKRKFQSGIAVFRSAVREHHWEYILLGILLSYGIIYFSYGAFQDSSYGFGDIYPHNAWIYGLTQGEIFSAGVYPEAMHCYVYSLHTLFGIRIYSCLLFLAGIHVMTYLMAAYALLKEIFRWRYTALFALTMFLTVDLMCINEVYSMSRLQWTLPQEFGLFTIYVCGTFLIRYLRSTHQMMRKGKLSKWYWDENLLVFMMSLAASLTIHFYPTIMAFFLCICVVPVFWRRVFCKKRFWPLVASVLCGVFIAVLPMGGALASGIPFQGSIGWAMSVIEGTDSDSNATDTTQSSETDSGESAETGNSTTDAAVVDGAQESASLGETVTDSAAGDEEVKVADSAAGEAEVTVVDSAAGDEKMTVTDSAAGDEETKVADSAAGDEKMTVTASAAGDEGVTVVDSTASGGEKTESTTGTVMAEIQQEVTAADEEQQEGETEGLLVRSFKTIKEKLANIYREGYVEMFKQERAKWIVGVTILTVILWLGYRLLRFLLNKDLRREPKEVGYFDASMVLTLASVAFVILYAPHSIGMPALVAGSRVCTTGQMLILAMMMIPVDMIFAGVKSLVGEITMKVMSTCFVVSIYLGTMLTGTFHGYLYYELTRFNGAVLSTYSITRELPKWSYTIVSPTDELYQMNQYGWHEELSNFVNQSQTEEYRIPSEYVFIFVEKKPIEYAQSHFFTGPKWLAWEKYADFYSSYVSQCPDITTSELSEVDLTGERILFETNSKTYSSLSTRTQVESKAYEWCQEFEHLYPGELKTYYEDEWFVCYYFKQNTQSLYQLGILATEGGQ